MWNGACEMLESKPTALCVDCVTPWFRSSLLQEKRIEPCFFMVSFMSLGDDITVGPQVNFLRVLLSSGKRTLGKI